MTSSPIVAFFRAFLLPREGIKAAVHRLTYELVFSGLALHTWRPGAARRQREGARRLGEWEFAVLFWMSQFEHHIPIVKFKDSTSVEAGMFPVQSQLFSCIGGALFDVAIGQYLLQRTSICPRRRLCF
ncbi:uncharacterized protein [Dermacentor andersoni]|uniref:uncharacterized protein isoform X3 n=1 Tax=Dermacentor andersoni TaxID=34620 RepID=UPI003B3B109A